MASATSVTNGHVGELAVAAELLSRRHIVCHMLPGYPAIDLVTLDTGHNVRKLVQVKYVPNRKASWLCTKAIERAIDPRLVYVFVCKAVAPCIGFDYYCLEQADLIAISKAQNAAAVKQKEIIDPAFKDNDMRRVNLADPKYLIYRNNFAIFRATTRITVPLRSSDSDA